MLVKVNSFKFRMFVADISKVENTNIMNVVYVSLVYFWEMRVFLFI